jgi:hypothetical protein
VNPRKLAIVAFVLSPTLAFADTAADEHFRAGRAAMTANNYEDAAREFEAASKTDSGIGIKLNWALAEEKLGRNVSAAARLEEVIIALPPEDERVVLAKTALKEVDRKVAKLTITTQPDATDAVVSIDSVAGARLGTAVRVEQGTRQVSVKSATSGNGEGSVLCTAGAPCSLVMKLVPVATTGASGGGGPAPATTSDGPSLPTYGYIALGIGGAAAIAGTVFGGLALGKKNDAFRDCRNIGSDAITCDATTSLNDREDSKSSGKTYAALSTGMFIGAGVFALGGLALILLAPSKSSVSARISPLRGGASSTLTLSF